MRESHTFILGSFFSCCNKKKYWFLSGSEDLCQIPCKPTCIWFCQYFSLAPSLGEKDNRNFYSNSFLSRMINKNLLRKRIASNYVCACLWLNCESFFNQVTGKLHDEDGTNCSAKAIHRLCFQRHYIQYSRRTEIKSMHYTNHISKELTKWKFIYSHCWHDSSFQIYEASSVP